MKNLEYLITTVDGENYDYDKEIEILKKSVNSLNDGGRNVIIIAIEELSELMQAIISFDKDKNNKNYLNLQEEIVDVYLSLGYINIVFDIENKNFRMEELYDNSTLGIIHLLSLLTQNLTKFLRGKEDVYQISYLYGKTLNALYSLKKYYEIDEEELIKIRKLKIERLRKVLEEGEKY